MLNSRKPVGPLEFALRIVLITAGLVGSERLLSGKTALHLNSVPPHLRASSSALCGCLFAVLAVDAINRRFLDIGLPRRFRRIAFVTFTIWVSATVILAYLDRYWLGGLILFAILLILGSLTPRTMATAGPSSMDNIADQLKKPLSLARNLPDRLHVSPLGFFRSLLTLACIWLPLIWLKDSFRHGIGALVADVGSGILYFIWVTKALGRFADSGRSSDWYWFPYCIAVTAASSLSLWLNLLNRYETLTLFMLLQIPLAILPSDPKSPRRQARKKRGKKYTTWRGEDVKALLVGPFRFLFVLLVIACLWVLLIYTANGSSDEIILWFSRIGYLILCVAWMVNSNGRLQDAGWAHSWYPSQYFLVVSVASLMPLAVHWVNGYGALLIFVLIQVPTLLLKSKPSLEDHISDEAPLNESQAGAPRS